MEAGKACLDLHGRHLLLRKRIVKIRRPEKKQAERTDHSLNRGKGCQQSPVRASGASGVAFSAEWASTVCGPAQTAEHAAARLMATETMIEISRNTAGGTGLIYASLNESTTTRDHL